MLFVKIFIGTSWDLYFLYKDNLYRKKTITEVSEDILNDLGFLFTQQGKDLPDITDMVRELFNTFLKEEDFVDCEQKRLFIEKYYGVYSQSL